VAPVLETRSDCSRCAALCCIAYPSQDMPGFSAAKAAGEPCPKLGKDGLCTIYENRVEQGFAGCTRYECFGAGQHVVQQLFGGRDWREDPALLRPMIEAFLAMRPVSDLAYLAEKAIEAAPRDGLKEELRQVSRELREIAGSLHTVRDSGRIARCEQALRSIYASLDPAHLRKS
jgi:hypothetical protein